MIIDTHAHYDDGQFDTDRDELLNSMHEGGIGLIVNAGSTLESWGKIRKLTDDYPFIYGAIGIHPDEVGSLTEDHMSEMEQLPGSGEDRGSGRDRAGLLLGQREP